MAHAQRLDRAGLRGGDSPGMVVIKGGWVEKSSGGKKDASSGTVKQGKESWKKRFVAVEDSPVQTLAWYKNEKVRCSAAASPSRRLADPCARGRHLARARRHRGASSWPGRRAR